MCLVNSVRSSSLIVCETLADDPWIWIRPPPPTLLFLTWPDVAVGDAPVFPGPFDACVCAGLESRNFAMSYLIPR